MSLLIDADYIVYKACAANETEIDYGDDVIVVTSNFSDAYESVLKELYGIADCLGCYDDSILFFSDSRNFRKLLAPTYKGQRNRKKPCGYKRVINALKEDFPVIQYPSLEADDALGIFATKFPGHTICSPDKDMRQIPGKLFNLTDPVITITPKEAEHWHYVQTLAGDQTDGYGGVPTIGIKRAITLFEKNGWTWETVVSAYESKDLTEEDALLNARLAKILQAENYDEKTGTIIYWTPTTNCKINDGAGVQAPTD